jgi:uncharacterized protein (TIGR02118 family)
MIKYIALYRTPGNVEDFEEKYFNSHKPLIDKVPGLVRQEIARVQRTYLAGFLGETEPYLIAELYFESKETMKEALKSSEWQVAGANLAEIGGMELVAMFSAEVVG